MRLFRRRHIRLLVPLFLGGALIAAIACGGETIVEKVVVQTVVVEKPVEKIVVQTVVVEKQVAGEKVVETVIVEKIVAGEKVVETVIVEKIVAGEKVVETVIVERIVEVTPVPVVALPTPAPEKIVLPQSQSPSGTIVVLPRRLPGAVGINRSQAPETLMYYGVTEQLFRPVGDELVGPWLATGWEVTADFSKATVTIRSGVQFHQGWGELSAVDIAWSVNDANGAINPTSIHGQAGDLASFVGEAFAADDRTLVLPFTRFDSRWDDRLFNQAGDAFGIFSKKAFDENGEEWMRENIIGTGPFEVVEWLAEDRAVLKAVETHWDKVPEVGTLRFLHVPESAVRRSMMETGEADIALVMPLRDVADLVATGFKAITTGTQWNNGLKFSGNYWEENHARTGEPLEHPTLLRENPWIGNPFNPDDGNNPPGIDDMEQARLVRWALSMAIDRQLVADTIFAGLVRPYYIGMFSPDDPNWESKWEVPYDPRKAEEYLDKAGYPKNKDGVRFNAQVYGFLGNSTYQDTADAVAGFWADIGVPTQVLRVSYGLVRPTFVGRSNSIPAIMTCVSDLWLPYDEPRGEEETSLTRGGFGCQLELPKVLETIRKLEVESDPVNRIAINKELADWMHHWMVGTGVTTGPFLNIYNPNAVKSWGLRTSPHNPVNSFELVVPAR